MAEEPSIPSPTTITSGQIKASIDKYETVVEAHYQNKIKDPRQRTEALKRDRWRYQELPISIKQQPSPTLDNVYLDIAQLEKLVQWKITHGHSRPFLPAMIRKNAPPDVKRITANAAHYLRGGFEGKAFYPPVAVEKALKELNCLKGVGPATASLVASVFALEEVPFFADESYDWLLNEGRGNLKLKYDKKEYAELTKAVASLRERLGKEYVTCVDIEKAVFVLMHLDLLEEVERNSLLETLNKKGVKADDLETDVAAAGDAGSRTPHGAMPISIAVKQTGEKRPKKLLGANKGEIADEGTERRSKRLRK